MSLFILTFTVYSQVRGFDFVEYDDRQIFDDLHVRHGLTWDGLKWAFTSSDGANWYPLTRLSHMLDSQLFGMDSGFHHLTNVLIHSLATLLLFAFLSRATRATWCSAFVAFMFALHPLHVESVAWVAERKDVLCALFWFLTLWTYVWYAERPGLFRYIPVLISFSLGVMVKPMIVTLPFVLFLVDIWPLRRKRTAALIWEKVPMLALSAASAVVTFVVQKNGGAVEALSGRPIGLRIENALVSYVAYIGQMFWPAKLAALYPYPEQIPIWQAAVAGAALGTLSIWVLRSMKGYPYLAIGWLWYLGTLIPVIGLVQVGVQARADRYMYVPMIGILIMLAWGAADIVERRRPARPFAVSFITILCSLSVVITWIQIGYWRTTESLAQRAVDVTDNNFRMYNMLGVAYGKTPGHSSEAIRAFKEALAINPMFAYAHMGLGTVLSQIPGRLPEALSEYQLTVQMLPGSAEAHFAYGVALSQIPSRLPEAITEYAVALRLQPDLADAHLNLGIAMAKTAGRLPEAISEYQAALRLRPDYEEAHINLGAALAQIPGRLPEAVAEDEAVLRTKPDYAGVRTNLGLALSKLPGRLPEAIAQYQTVLRGNPNYADAHINLGVALSQVPGRLPEAIAEYRAALQLMPDSVEAHYNLANALAATPGRLPEAISELEAAYRIRPDPAAQRLLDRFRALSASGMARP